MELGREATLQEVAERAGLPLKQALEVEEAARASISLDQPLADQEGALFGDMVAGEGPPPEESVEDTLRYEALTEALALLDERQQTVIVLRYGASRFGAEDARRDWAAAWGIARARAPARDGGAQAPCTDARDRVAR